MADALLVLKIITDAKDAAAGLDDASDSVGKFNGNMAKAAAGAAVAGGAVLAFGLDAARAAAEDAQGQALLANTMQNMLGTAAAAASGMEDWISAASAASGVADDQLRPAMASLISSTADATKSQELMKQAMDISAATGQDLGTVTDAIAKGYQGNTKALSKLVPGLDAGVVASKDFNLIMEELNATTGGASAAASETAAGKMQRMQLAMDETKESIGGALLPAFTKLADIMLTVATWAQNNSTVFLILMGVILAVSAVILAYSIYQKVAAAATAIWTAAQWLLNTAFLASPLTWIVIGIVALIAVVVLIATKTTWFQDIWNAAWDAIKGAAQAVWNWISGNWPLILAILTGPIGLAVKFIIDHLDDITGAAKSVWDFLTGAFSSVWDTIKNTATAAISPIVSAVDGIKSAFDGVISVIKSVIDWLSKIKVPEIKFPDLNPFNNSASAAAAAPVGFSAYGATRAVPRATGGGGGSGPTIIIQGAVDPVATANQIRRILRDDSRRRGGVAVGTT